MNNIKNYLKAIVREHHRGDDSVQLKIEKKLEELIENLNGSSFDVQKARKIRKTLLTIRELSDQLGIPEGSLRSYESRGISKAPTRPTATSLVKYLEWLKENGYNPFKLR